MGTLVQEGTFEARVTDAEFHTADSGAMAVNLEFEVIREYSKQSKEYSEPWPAGFTFSGSVWVVKKDTNEIVEKQVQRLVKAIGWDGEIDNLGKCIGAICKCDVKREEYKEIVTYKAAFINPAGEADLSEISEKFGGFFKAIAAEVGPITPHRTAAPAAKPTAPPAPLVPANTAAEDTVPF